MTFQTHALEKIRQLAEAQDEFCSDDLYLLLEMDPHDPNQVGAAFREAAKLGIIEATGRIVKSKRPAAKRRNIQIWQATTKIGTLL